LFMEDNKNLSIFLFDDRELNNIPHPSLRSALKCMKQASDLMRSLGPISFLESLIKNKFGLYNMGKEYSQSEKYDADSALRQTMEIIKSEGCTSIYEVRNTLEKLVDNKVNYELPLDNEFAQNAIRVMNVHKAKGLEAAIVLLVGSDKGRGFGQNSHYVDKSH